MNRLQLRTIRTLRHRYLPVIALLALVLLANVAIACPTCKDNLAADPASANLVRGYFWSILFMMSMPFLILGSLGSYFYWEIRKARAQQQALAVANQKTDFVESEERELAEV